MKDNLQKYNVFDLSESHKNLIGKYLTFFKAKQDKFVREVKSTVEDFKEQNLKDMMYSQQDLKEIFDNLKDNISTTMNNEISYYLNMNAIFVQLLLHDADNQKTSLKVEMSQIQNLNNINEMNEFIKTITGQNLPSGLLKGNTVSKLSSISKTQNLINDYEQLKHDYDMLQQNFNIIKNQNELLIKENQNLQANGKLCSSEINELRNRLKNTSLENNSHSDNFEKLQTDLEITKKNLDEQISKYQKLVSEYDVKLSQSIQFQQLKKLLQDKNNLIIELKTKIAKFEEDK